MALLTGAFVAGILVLALVLVLLEVFSGGPSPATPSPPPQASASVVAAVAGAPGVALAAAAPGPLDAGQLQSGQPPLQVAGRPAVVFVGAEFSPYSAAASWALVAALGRFGTFRQLGSTLSASTEVFSHTPGFSFYGTGYTSAEVSFEAVEGWGDTLSAVAPAGYPTLDRVPEAVSGLLRRYDPPGGAGATLPFLDVGNRLVLVGASIGYSPGLLHGMDLAGVAGALGDPTSPVARAVLGTADEITAVVCSEDGMRPASVCTDQATSLAAAHLGLG
ncbi:MAG: DUF929 family protein [Acidobacteriota bacterium]|nr:DUF929 family protein [Acidobacteriota bacterium]